MAAGFVHVLIATTSPRMARGGGGGCDAATAARLCSALGKLRIWPGRVWMRGAYGALMRGHEELGPAEIGGLLSGMADMPQGAPGNNVGRGSEGRLPSLDLGSYGGGSTGAESDHAQGSDPPSSTIEAGPGDPCRDAGEASSSLGAPSVSGHPFSRPSPPRRLMQLLLMRLLRCSGAGHVNHVADAMWASVRLGCRPPSGWVDRALHLCCSERAMKQVRVTGESESGVSSSGHIRSTSVGGP